MKKINNFPVPGMRVIKTALAIFLCLLTMELMDEKFSSYSAVVAIVCMQKDWYNSVQVAKDRSIGTLIGALFGLIAYLLIFYLNLGEITILAYLVIALMMVILIMTTISLNGSEIIAITCIIFLSVATFQDTDTNIYYFAIRRVIDTFIGIVIALVVNVSINEKVTNSIKKFLGIE